MKQLYRTLPILLTVGMFGCGNSNTATPQEDASSTDTAAPSDSIAPSESKDSFVSQLPASAPVLKVAMTGDIPPFSFQDDYGNMQGSDVDSIRAIGEEQGFKVEFHKENQKTMLTSVASGERDLALSGIAYSDERATNYGLSGSYFFNPGAIMYTDSSLNIKSLDDVKGLRVGVLEGTGKEAVLQQMADVELISTPTSYLSYEKLIRDEIDVIVDDYPTLKYLAKNHPEYKVTIVPYETIDNQSAQQIMVMAKGNTELINNVNEGISKLKANGRLKEIEERWLGETVATPETGSITTE